MDLLNRRCSLITPGTTPLTRKEIVAWLKEIPDWRLEDGHLYRRFSCKDFRQCVEYVNAVVSLSLEEAHFPDLCISQSRYVDLLLYSYTIGGLSMNDMILAAKITRRLAYDPMQSAL